MKPTLTNTTKPGELIKNELRERKISQKDFAKAIGVGASHLSDILSGRRRLTILFANRTEELLGLPAKLLMDMQTANEIVCDSARCADTSEFDAKTALDTIDSVLSVKTLLKFLKKKYKTNVEKLAALREYYGVTSNAPTEVRAMIQGCYRKSSATGMDEIMISTWVTLVQAISRKVKPSGIFSIDKMNVLCEEVVYELHKNRPGIIMTLMNLLSSYGIGLLRVEKVERASIDGYSFFNNGIPYIALTCRYDRIDNLAFTLLHELAHITLGHTNQGKSQLNIDRRSYDEEYNDRIEDEANTFASEKLIPSEIWQFAPKISLIPSIIKSRYTKWAESNNLNPWIVLGRLSYETGIYKFPGDESRKINGGKEVCHELI